jgi:hypothetical protein
MSYGNKVKLKRTKSQAPNWTGPMRRSPPRISMQLIQPMKVREATIQDKAKWDSFVDDNNGTFLYYFDWGIINAINEDSRIQRTALIVETDRWNGICRLNKVNKTLYSSLFLHGATGILFKNDLSHQERTAATSILLEYIRKNFASKCSSLSIREETSSSALENGEYNRTLLDNGFRISHSGSLPCSHVLPLKPPFEENIWKGLWSQNLRHNINKVEKRGVKVIQDKEHKYVDLFLDMRAANYKRHGLLPPDRDKMKAELDIFRDKTKIFVALEENVPVVIMFCHYTPSTCYLWEIGSFTKGTDRKSVV